jgi:hypothetical protein
MYVIHEASASPGKEQNMMRCVQSLTLRRLLVTASVLPSSPILVTLMRQALNSFETSVLRRTTRRNIPEDVILHNHRRENLISYDIQNVPNL